MGIINLTPDSFYAASRAQKEDKLLNKVETLLDQGMDILDLGAMSSRPGASIIDIKTEIERLSNFISLIKTRFPQLIVSVDTFRSEVAQFVLDQGADMINDIYAGTYDERIFEMAATYDASYILMHMKGDPTNMQDRPEYRDVLIDLISFFGERISTAKTYGLSQIIIDPGFGFGKRLEDNFKILKNMSALAILDCPLLAGLSRKSMIYKTLDGTAEKALNGTTFLHFKALEQGAKILRVHDVKAAKECVELYAALNPELA